MEAIALRTNLLKLMDGMSEAKLAKAVSVPKATINRIISGRTPDPRAGTLLPIAQYFGVTLEQLLGIVPLPDSLPLEAIRVEEITLSVPYVEIEQLYAWFDNTYQITMIWH